MPRIVIMMIMMMFIEVMMVIMVFVMVRYQFDQRALLPGLNMKSLPRRFHDDLIDDKVVVAEDYDALDDGNNMIIVIVILF